MRKTHKYLRFEQLKLELQNEHPKQVSRAVVCLRDEDGSVFKTSEYGQVTPKEIDWPGDFVEILYTNQEMFYFETICEHEYGYEIQELKALYNGQLYIKTEFFFRPLTIHIYNEQGEKCGILRYIIKVIEKDIESAQKSKPDSSLNRVEPEVKVDLLAKLTFYAASMTISSPLFKKDKYVNDFSLRVEICGQKIEGVYKKNYSWSFPSTKVQHMDNSPHQVIFTLLHENHEILKGQTDINYLADQKRFITHSFPLFDQKNEKMGTLKVDLRYVDKQQILDLLYSPTKLAHSKAVSKPDLDKLERQTKLQSSRVGSPKKFLYKIPSPKIKSHSTANVHHKRSLDLKSSRQHSIQENEREINRYRKILMLNGSGQSIIPKAKRFEMRKDINPYVSYCDPAKYSDFSPNRPLYDYGMSKSKKTDFTRPYRHNPGVGQYKLPSIWDKY